MTFSFAVFGKKTTFNKSIGLFLVQIENCSDRYEEEI